LEAVVSFVLSGMRWLENVVKGLWGAIGVGAVAILASAAPNMFADGADARCWASALTMASLAVAEQAIFVIVVLTMLFSLGRRLVQLCTWRASVFRVMVGFLFGLLIWCVTLETGISVFASTLQEIGSVLAEPPAFPAAGGNRAACGHLITGRPASPTLVERLFQALAALAGG
jgi:hypothetical protein